MVAFGRLASDQEVADLVRQCDLKVLGIWHATPYGFSGSGRVLDPEEPIEKILKRRRQIVARHFWRGESYPYLWGYEIPEAQLMVIYEELWEEIKAILEEGGRQSDRLLRHLRRLLNLYYQHKESYEYVMGQGPIVYALLVETQDSGESCVRRHHLVRHLVRFSDLSRSSMNEMKPDFVKEYYWFSWVKVASPEKVLTEIETIVKSFMKYGLKTKANFLDIKEYTIRLMRHFIGKKVMDSYYFPNEGYLQYISVPIDPDDSAVSQLEWISPGDWSTANPGYEHDLVAREDYFTGCTSSTNLPNGYDDCVTACVLDSPPYCSFTFGSYHISAVTPDIPYSGAWTLYKGTESSTDFRLNAQEVEHGRLCFFRKNHLHSLPFWYSVLHVFDLKVRSRSVLSTELPCSCVET